MKRCFAIGLILLGTGMLRTAAQDTLLLFHPTSDNLQVLESLVSKGVLCLDGYHILGVYHEKEQYDYRQTQEFIEQDGSDLFSLEVIEGMLGPGDLFGANSCTRQFNHLFSISSGAMFMGGPDIPPAVYDEPVYLLTRVEDPFRHFVESSYLFHLLGGSQQPDWQPYMESRSNYMISGICLGMQTMNVATGGTLVQDIPSELYGIWNVDRILSADADMVHRNYADMMNTGCEDPTSYHFHRVKLQEDSFFFRNFEIKYGTQPLVLSSHHQALEKMGAGWVVSAQSVDGKIVEAIEHEKYPHVFGVQFHPEKPGLYDPGIVHALNCKETISFQARIRNSESQEFHKAYWKFVGDVLKDSRPK